MDYVNFIARFILWFKLTLPETSRVSNVMVSE
jgi:hypothetical protein